MYFIGERQKGEMIVKDFEKVLKTDVYELRLRNHLNSL